MRKLKLIFPMLAFLLAIGLSFAFVNATAEDYYTAGFIQMGTTWYPVDVNCEQNSQYECRVQIEGEPETYEVHSAPNETAPTLKSASPNAKVIQDPR